jgi:hypothetical protein
MTCKECKTPMTSGIALMQTYTGIGDFHDNDAVSTLSPGGPGQIASCWKCPACGWSMSK